MAGNGVGLLVVLRRLQLRQRQNEQEKIGAGDVDPGPEARVVVEHPPGLLAGLLDGRFEGGEVDLFAGEMLRCQADRPEQRRVGIAGGEVHPLAIPRDHAL